MSKKFGKFLLFSAVAGAAAYGAYYYLHEKDNAPAPAKGEDTDDDFDDFSEDLDDEPAEPKGRSYVSLNLDKAEAFASEAFHKAKEVISDSVQQVKETVRSVKESQLTSDSNFTDLTAINKEKEAEKKTAEEAPASAENTAEKEKSHETVDVFVDDPEAPESASPKSDAVSSPDAGSEKVEDFFDEDEA